MGRLSAPLLANIKRAVDVWEVDLPDGSTWRMGPIDAPQASTSQGWYEPRVRGWVPWGETLGDTDNAIQIPTCSIPITDVPGKTHCLRDMLGKGDRVQNSPVRRYTAAPLPVIHADWCQKGAGVLDDWSLDSESTATLKVRPDDSALGEGSITGKSSSILKRKASLYDWPNLPTANEGKLLGFVVGKHSDEGKNFQGALTLWQIDSAAYWYYVSIGRVNVLRVYRAGAIKTLTTDYTVEYPLVNGIRYTVVNFVANPGADAITADVEGFYTVGTGSGVPIMDSAAAMRHVLSNLVFGADATHEPWKDGVWLPESSRIHTASWDAVATKLASRANGAAYVSAIVVDDDRSGYTLLNQWLKAHHLYAYWRGDGKLALFVWDPNTPAAPIATLTETDCAKGGFRLVMGRDKMLRSLIGQFGTGATAGNSRYELEVVNPLALTDRADKIDCSTGPNTWP